MEELKIVSVAIVIIVMLVGTYELMIRHESKKIYTIQGIQPQRVDERGKELCYSSNYYWWQQKKLGLIKRYYGIDSIIEDERVGVEYKITDIRGPYKKASGSFFEYELEFKVISIQAKDEIIIEGKAVKIYDECKYRFDMEDYRDEIQNIYDIICVNELNTKDIAELFNKVYFMKNTNLMKYKDLVTIKEVIEQCINEADRKNFKFCNFINEILKQSDQYRYEELPIIQEGGQLNLAQGNGKIDARQNIYVYKNHKSNFAKRLDELIDIMNEARLSYEEPITVGYICEHLGYESENELRQYYLNAQEPDRGFMEFLAEELGVNKKWLAKGATVPIFEISERRNNLSDILREIPKIEDMYIAIREEEREKYLLIILKYDDIKYVCHKESFIFFLSSGAGGQTQLMEVYEFFKTLHKMKNREGRDIYPSKAYFLSKEDWVNLKEGNMYPAAIRKIRMHKAYIMEDFLDIRNMYRTKEQYRLWYGEEFVECQEYIKNRLSEENM